MPLQQWLPWSTEEYTRTHPHAPASNASAVGPAGSGLAPTVELQSMLFGGLIVAARPHTRCAPTPCTSHPVHC